MLTVIVGLDGDTRRRRPTRSRSLMANGWSTYLVIEMSYEAIFHEKPLAPISFASAG